MGKTTTIGKIATRLVNEGKKVMLVAGDTFRAAAADQLEIWAGRSGAWTINIETTGKNRLLKSADGADAEDSIQSLYDLVEALGYRSQWKEV